MTSQKATDRLLTDHRMVRKLLEGLQLDNPRYAETLETLHRVLMAHAWFEDEIFLPVFRAEPRFYGRFLDEITQEHKDLYHVMSQLRAVPAARTREMEDYILQARAILDAHFKKEEDALFPVAEHILDSEGLLRLGDEMERRKMEVRKLPLKD